jgi:hypothetical protein
MNNFDIFITFIFIVKIIFIIISSYIYYLEIKNPEGDLIEKLKYWKYRLEFIFIICMSTVCIYLFSPFTKKEIDRETRLLLFTFGFIILITADWGLFFKETKWTIYLQKILGTD